MQRWDFFAGEGDEWPARDLWTWLLAFVALVCVVAVVLGL